MALQPEGRPNRTQQVPAKALRVVITGQQHAARRQEADGRDPAAFSSALLAVQRRPETRHLVA